MTNYPIPLTGPIAPDEITPFFNDLINKINANLYFLGPSDGKHVTVTPQFIYVTNTGGDDTSNLQYAINLATSRFADKIPIILPSQLYTTTGLALNPYTKIIGYNCSIYLNSPSNGPIIQIPSEAPSEPEALGYIVGLRLNGWQGKNGSDTCLSMGNHATYVMHDIVCTNAQTGFSIAGAQFDAFNKCKAVNCGVGFFLRSILVEGGGNSNSFYDVYTSGCIVGMILYGDNYLPSSDMHLYNPTFLTSTICHFASISGGPYANTNFFYGNSSEHTGTGGSTQYIYVCPAIGGLGYLVIPNTGYYASYSKTTFRNASFAEAFISPTITAVSQSTIVLDNCYGPWGGTFVSCDATSDVILNGVSGGGSIEQISDVNFIGQINWSPTSVPRRNIFSLPPHVYIDTTIANSVLNPFIGDITDFTNTSSNTTVFDANYGTCLQAVFPASVTGRINASITTNTRSCVAFNMLCSVDAAFTFGLSDGSGLGTIQFRAGQWRRICWFQDNMAVGTKAFYIQPGDSAGATVTICKWHVCSGTGDLVNNSQIAKIIKGAFNPKIPEQREQAFATSIPIVGTWGLGDIVWNSTPSAGGVIGWVCTSAGTPGTWKTFGAIAA